ncbi:pre-mRNA-splicing factor CWC25 homolog [Rhodnius prolixus]|uniref:pre-mRNA-splicing factor CWC25 homolog n=1 Tax=Rhodnius prolixus TaxID=13249 RepID=UPI003D18869E
MEWMYKDSSDTVDREEYLLGRAIDKNIESQLSGSFNEVDKDITPASIFTNSCSNIQVDVIRKLKEDPLEQIRQKELETRKQLLKNPVKLKKIQNMLKAKEEMVLKKKAKKQKKKSQDRSIDELLTSKYLKLKEKLGGKNLVELGKSSTLQEGRVRSDGRSKKKKEKRKSLSESSTTSEYSSSSSEEEEEICKRDNKTKQCVAKDNKSKSSFKRNIGLEERKPGGKRYGLDPRGQDRSNSLKPSKASGFSSYAYNEMREAKCDLPNKSLSKRRAKLSEEEKAKRLKEMTQNVTWRNQLTKKSVKRFKEEEKKEKEVNEKEFDDGFLRRQMALATSHATVHERIKSNVNNIQRSERHMSENFARR